MGGLNGIEIFLGYTCNLKCNFCFQKDLRLKNPKFISYDNVIDIIKNGIKDGKKAVVFSGGEATLDQNLIKYIDFCNKNGFSDIRVHTNGLTFSNKDILNKYLSVGMTGVIISIHGYGNIHDYLVGLNGAFDKVKTTLINLSEYKKINPKFVIDTNTVLNKFNYKNLNVLFKFLSYFPIARSQIVQLYSLYLYSLKEKSHLYISYDKLYGEIDKIVASGKNITFENIPLCKIDKKHWNLILKRHKYDNEAYGNIGEGFEESDCTYLANCDGCSYKNECVGIPKDYLSVFGGQEFII